MIDMAAVERDHPDDARVRSNRGRVLAVWAQALTGANFRRIFATGSIVVATLSPAISLATVPRSHVCVWLATGTLADRRHRAHRLWSAVSPSSSATGCGVLTALSGAVSRFCAARFLRLFAVATFSSADFMARWGANPTRFSLPPTVRARRIARRPYRGAGRWRVRRVLGRSSCSGRWMSAALFVRLQLVFPGDGRAIAMAISPRASTRPSLRLRFSRGRPLFENRGRQRALHRNIAGPQSAASVSYHMIIYVMTSAPLGDEKCVA